MCDSLSFGAKGNDMYSYSVREGILPSKTSLTHEGTFYKYYFETGQESEKIFSISSSLAITKDPFSKKKEYYACIGMNSKYDGDGLKKFNARPGLNLVIVLDISGSMDSRMTQRKTPSNAASSEVKPEVVGSKLDVAKQNIHSLVEHLLPTDMFSLITFDDTADIVFPLTMWSAVNKQDLRKKIDELRVRGGTDFEKGIVCATDILKSRPNLTNNSNENRIFVLTDAEPTVGSKDGSTFLNILKDNAENHKIYATLIGIGLDFNTDLVEFITKVRATNYFCILSPSEFKKTMDEDFDYNVTPTAFDISLTCETSGIKIERVYGSPGFEIPTGSELMHINSVFPSGKRNNTETKGGVVLLKISSESVQNASSVILRLTYEDREGKKHVEDKEVSFNFSENIPAAVSSDEDYFENSGVRKAVILTRFVNMIHHCIDDSVSRRDKSYVAPKIEDTGIKISELPKDSNRRDYSSNQVSDDFRNNLSKFGDYFSQEIQAIQDMDLNDELKTIGLITTKSSNSN